MVAQFSELQDSGETLLVIAVVAAIYGIFGVVCAVLAPARGRSAVAWFFIGVATQCLGIILILLLPNLKVEEQRQRRREEETRRLREMLQKDRQVADDRQRANHSRLAVHDQALGVDTATAAAAPQLGQGVVPPPLPQPAAEPEWYFAIGKERLGPVTAARLRDLFVDQKVDGQTLVWRSGMADWVKLADVADLMAPGPRP